MHLFQFSGPVRATAFLLGYGSVVEAKHLLTGETSYKNKDDQVFTISSSGPWAAHKETFKYPQWRKTGWRSPY